MSLVKLRPLTCHAQGPISNGHGRPGAPRVDGEHIPGFDIVYPHGATLSVQVSARDGAGAESVSFVIPDTCSLTTPDAVAHTVVP